MSKKFGGLNYFSYICNMKYTLGKYSFKNKSEVSKKCQGLLSCESDTVVEGDNLLFILDLLKCHPEYLKKVGGGIKQIIITDEMNGKSEYFNHFHIFRKDNSDIDFSYVTCIKYLGEKTKKVSKALSDFRFAARYEIRQDIQDFRDLCFGNKKYLECELLKVNFSKVTCHVDHKTPKTFVFLVDKFIKKENININEVEYSQKYKGVGFKDESLVKSWVEFHRLEADLRCIHKTANLSKISR